MNLLQKSKKHDKKCLPDTTNGKSVIIPSDEIVAGTMGTWILRYTVGPGGIAIGGGIRVAFEHGSDWGHPQTDYPKSLNYVTAITSGKSKLCTKGAYLSWSAVVSVTVEEAPLKAGEVIEVTLGDKSAGSPGFKVQSFTQNSCEIIVFEDTKGNGKFKRISPAPAWKIISDRPVRLTALAKSYSYPGKAISLIIRAEDKYGNVAEDYRGKIVVAPVLPDREKLKSATIGPKKFIKEYKFTREDKDVKRINDIVFDSPGIKRVVVKDNNFETLSNPIVCGQTDGEEKICWGQIHGHTIMSDGLGTPDEYYRYARDVSNLDFAAITDHGIWTDADIQPGDQKVDPNLLRHYLDKKAWRVIQESSRKYNEPGKFVTLLGYEWCSTKYGDKNIYFFADDEVPEYPNTPLELYYALRGRKAMVISHMMSGILGKRCINWNYFNEELERLVEICSFHGIKEYAGNPFCKGDYYAQNHADQTKGNMVQDALARGYRLGVVGGSDDHTGKPGSDVKGVLPCRINGLTAVPLKSLTRDNLWGALYNRRCYATTGARIILDFTLNDYPMGSKIKDERGGERNISVNIHGTDKIKKIEIVKNNNSVYVYQETGLDVAFTYSDKREKRCDYYYIRVIQEDGQMAWSSPIWVAS